MHQFMNVKFIYEFICTGFISSLMSRLQTTTHLSNYSDPVEHLEDRASWYILIIKPRRCTKFSNLFVNRTLHTLDKFSVHHYESITVYTAIGICHTAFSECLLAGSGSGPASKQSAKPVWRIPVAVYTVLDSWWWTDNLSEICRVLFQK
jgi:hypothetical protein